MWGRRIIVAGRRWIAGRWNRIVSGWSWIAGLRIVSWRWRVVVVILLRMRIVGIDWTERRVVGIRVVPVVPVELLLDLCLWCAALRTRLFALEHVGHLSVSEASEAQKTDDARAWALLSRVRRSCGCRWLSCRRRSSGCRSRSLRSRNSRVIAANRSAFAI